MPMYVTEEYYYSEFHGEPIESEDFTGLQERAAEIVEEMTMYRISEQMLPSLPEELQERIRKAVCAQMEFLDANGGSEVDNGMDMQSASLGRFSYTRASGVEGGSVSSCYSPRAKRILAPTGLLQRAGGIL